MTRRIPPARTSIKAGQPYWRLAKNLLEKQDYPDPALRTYDDSGWTMGYAFNVDVKEIRDKAVLDVPTTLVKAVDVKGTHHRNMTGDGAALAVAHFGSNNMIAFRYKLKNVPMKVAEKPVHRAQAGSTSPPARSSSPSRSQHIADGGRAAAADAVWA